MTMLSRREFFVGAAGTSLLAIGARYIPGEFGVRLEDCWTMAASGPRLFTPLAKSLDAPI
jgi:Xaa-Pro aminopeptidase